MEQEFESPKCDKCGAEITTGLMAAFCPEKKDCEFYVDGIDDLMKMFEPENPDINPDKVSR